MKMKSIRNSRSRLLLTALFVLSVSAESSAQTLYGIVGAGPDSGKLVTINTSTGGTTDVGNIGISPADGSPNGMAYGSNSGLLYVTTYGIGNSGKIFTVDPSTAASAPFGDAFALSSTAIAYRYVDDLLYRLDQSTASLIISRWDAAGNWVDDLGFLQDVIAIQGLSVRPSDGTLFGAGYNSLNQDALFTIPTTGDPFTVVPVTQVGLTGNNILALAFWPNGVLLGSNGSNLIRIDVSTGSVQTFGAFGTGPIVGLAVVADFTPGPVDVWMKDCLEDVGDIPSVPEPPCTVAFKSPDIWIDNNQDMILDGPVYGEENNLMARIRNRESGVAEQVTVGFYYRDNTTGLHFPEGATPIGEDVVTVPPNGQALASVRWNIPEPPTTGGHWCIGVVVDHPSDPLPSPAPSTKDHNNIAMANMWYIAGREGEAELMSFSLSTGGSWGFGLRPWPREFTLEVDVELPAGWNWELEGAPVGEPFTLKLGEEREVKLVVQVAEGAPPHSGGSVEVRQVDVATHQVVGGLIYNLYEDHFPPEPVRQPRANLVDGYTLLSWAEVRKEAKTGLRERVTYYEVLRDGEAVAKVVLDGDPHRPGYQWKDPDPVKGTVTYAIRVADEGGNVSEASPRVKVEGPQGPGKWLTWLLLLVIGVLLVLVIWRRSAS